MLLTSAKYWFVFLVVVKSAFAEDDLSEDNSKNSTSDTESVSTPSVDSWHSRMRGSHVFFHGTKQYHVFNHIQLNWFEAFAFCKSNGMSLASPSTQEANRFLVHAIRSSNLAVIKSKDYWISATDLTTTNNYVWMSTGKAVTYSDWLPGEPNHTYLKGEVEHCAEIQPHKKHGGWNDYWCSYREFFICEK